MLNQFLLGYLYFGNIALIGIINIIIIFFFLVYLQWASRERIQFLLVTFLKTKINTNLFFQY